MLLLVGADAGFLKWGCFRLHLIQGVEGGGGGGRVLPDMKIGGLLPTSGPMRKSAGGGGCRPLWAQNEKWGVLSTAGPIRKVCVGRRGGGGGGGGGLNVSLHRTRSGTQAYFNIMACSIILSSEKRLINRGGGTGTGGQVLVSQARRRTTRVDCGRVRSTSGYFGQCLHVQRNLINNRVT